MKVYLDHNAKIFLATRDGKVWVHGVVIGPPVKHTKVLKSDLRYYRDASFRGKPYPVGLAKTKLRHAGKLLGITPGAVKELRQ